MDIKDISIPIVGGCVYKIWLTSVNNIKIKMDKKEITIPIFDGEDYNMWKKRITMFLRLKKCIYNGRKLSFILKLHLFFVYVDINFLL